MSLIESNSCLLLFELCGYRISSVISFINLCCVGYLVVKIGDGNSLCGHLIGVITGCRRGYSIDYIVLIMSRAMKRAQP